MKENMKLSISTWKTLQLHYLPGQCTLRTQWDVIHALLGSLRHRRLAIANLKELWGSRSLHTLLAEEWDSTATLAKCQFLEVFNLLCVCARVCAKSPQSCAALCDPMNCSPRGFSVHGFFGQECHEQHLGSLPSNSTPRCVCKRNVCVYPCKALYQTFIIVKSWLLINTMNCCCSVAQSCLTLCDPVDCSTPGSSVLHYLLELAQTHVHWVGDAIQSSHPLSSPSPLALHLIEMHQSLFQWTCTLHQVARVLEFQLQWYCFQWIFRINFF